MSNVSVVSPGSSRHFEWAQPGFHDKNTGAGADLLRLGLYPGAFLNNAVQAMLPDGALLAILIGSLGLGSEYGWGTLKPVFVQGPSRVATFAGRILATSAVLAIIVLICFAAAAGTSLVIASLDNHAATAWPSWGEAARVLGASWLVLICYAATGIALAAALRNATLAIGFGIFYLVIFESAVVDLLKPLWPAVIDNLEKLLPGVNASRCWSPSVHHPGSAFQPRSSAGACSACPDVVDRGAACGGGSLDMAAGRLLISRGVCRYDCLISKVA